MRLSKSKSQINIFQKLHFIYPPVANPRTLQDNGLEFIYVEVSRRSFKITFKNYKKIIPNRKIWLNLQSNYTTPRKFENDRMTDSKHLFFSWPISLNPMVRFMKFFGYYPLGLQKILRQSDHHFHNYSDVHIKQCKYVSWVNQKKIVYTCTRLTWELI